MSWALLPPDLRDRKQKLVAGPGLESRGPYRAGLVWGPGQGLERGCGRRLGFPRDLDLLYSFLP